MEKWMSLEMILLLLISLKTMGQSFGVEAAEEVTYDGRSLIINGHRNILFSGSIHYPRSTPQVYAFLQCTYVYIHIIACSSDSISISI